MRRSAVWALLLLQAALVASANVHPPVGDDITRAAQDGQNRHASQAKADLADSEQAPPQVRQEGADLVDAAMGEFRRIPQSAYQRNPKSSSIITKALRFILASIPLGPTTAPSQQESTTTTLGGPLLSAVQYLQQATLQNNSDAMYILAELNFFGNYSHPRDLRTAFRHYKELATIHGNTTAQYMIGLYYSTGLGNVVPRNQAMALLYYTLAAVRGDARAEMATGFRHNSGIGAIKDCETAIKYYKRVADNAIRWFRSGPPGGMSWVQQRWRIADDDGGLFGEGASASSAGMNAFKPGPHSDAYASIGDVMEYLDFLSRKGDWTATLDLGKRYYEGRRGLEPDHDLAKKYFLLVASKYWKRDGTIVDNYKPGIEKIAGRAAGYIGRMYMRAEGFPKNFDRGKVWLERGISQGDAQSQYGLGLMLLKGYGGHTNIPKAAELFRVSAEQDYAPAHVQMGQLYLDQGSEEDVRVANNHFELAARYGNIEAMYYLAEMIVNGVGRERMCGSALNYYKSVSERAEPLVSSWADANDAYEAGDYETAFLEYLMAAEQGYEKAQTNVAWMLDVSRSQLPIGEWLRGGSSRSALLTNPELALIYWTRSSRQSNVDALVKMGDYYLNGVGAEADVDKAVQCYTGASDYSQSAQALFNLGWMHENGVGMTQDFHLAKRYYDNALEVNEEAYLPATLSLLKLRLRSAWNTLTNGPVHSIQDEPKPKQEWSLSEWVTNFLRAEGYEYEDYYQENMYDGTLGDDDDFDDAGLLESLLIIGITMSLVLLLWWRQRMQQAHAQDDDAQRRDQGLPPRQPAAANQLNGDDAFWGWAAGGVGL